MKENGIFYLDDFLLTNIEDNQPQTYSTERNSYNEMYEIEEYILRKQAENMNTVPQTFYHEEFFPVLKNDYNNKIEKKKQISVKVKRRLNYKPKNVRGEGVHREGYCEMCNRWFRLKTSSYWYHMNFKHGIAANGMMYPEPEIYYNGGKAYSNCESCRIAILLGGNNKALKYNWYKHFQKEHAKAYE